MKPECKYADICPIYRNYTKFCKEFKQELEEGCQIRRFYERYPEFLEEQRSIYENHHILKSEHPERIKRGWRM